MIQLHAINIRTKGVKPMRFIAIAIIENTGIPKQIRILNIDTGKYTDVKALSLCESKELKEGSIANLKFEDGQGIVGSNGSLDRLPKIVNGQLVGRSPVIILDQLDEEGYRVCDFKGEVKNVRVKDLINYANTNGIANGKVVTKAGKQFISSINGHHSYINKNTENSIIYERDDFKLDCMPHKLCKGELERDKTMGHIELQIKVTLVELGLEKDIFKIEIEATATPTSVNQYTSARKLWYLHSIDATIRSVIPNAKIIDLQPKSKNNEWQEKTTAGEKSTLGSSISLAAMASNLSSEYSETKEVSKSVQDFRVYNTVKESRKASWKLKTNSKEAMTSTGCLESNILLSLDKQKPVSAIISIDISGVFINNEKSINSDATNIGLDMQRSSFNVHLTIRDRAVIDQKFFDNTDTERLLLEEILSSRKLTSKIKKIADKISNSDEDKFIIINDLK